MVVFISNIDCGYYDIYNKIFHLHHYTDIINFISNDFILLHSDENYTACEEIDNEYYLMRG
jgi:hypothetical protein